jgi:hypothetical protein
MYSRAEREKLHPEGVDLVFGGRFVMRPEQADSLAFGLVQFDRASGMYRRVQFSPVEERMLIESAQDRQRSEASIADRGQPTPWSSGRTPYPQSSVTPRKAKR